MSDKSVPLSSGASIQRAGLHYLFTVAILSIYGGQVCPYIADLNIASWAVSLMVVFGAAFALRKPLLAKYVHSAPPHQMVRKQFITEMSLFLSAGVVISIHDMIFYDFPAGSGLKVIIGCATLGFFAAVDLSLERERLISREIAESGSGVEPDESFFPLTKKIVMVTTTLILFVTMIVAMVVFRDIMLLTSTEPEKLMFEARAVVIELAFIAAVVFAETVNIIVSYSANLRLFFGNENSTLGAVAGGDLDSRVPISTNDEFGVMAKYTNQMIGALKTRTEELQTTRDVTILTLASLAETRDNETGAHILRTQRYVKALAEHLRDKPGFSDALDDETIDLLYKSAPLHDIGKVGVRDAVLLKPGKLTDEEFEEMKMHPVYGRDSLQSAAKILGDNSFLRYAEEIAYTHHEKWSGGGYPNGLKGEEIPLSGRLMAVADVYDALISKRVYKEAFSHEKARGIILEWRGKQFDPAVVDAFTAIEEQFIAIAAEFADGKEIEAAA